MYNREKESMENTKPKRNIKSKVATINSKAYTLEDVKELLKRNNKAVERAILLLYSFQTLEEQKYGHTGEWNNKGFNRVDANILSSFAEQLSTGRSLSSKQLVIARLKIMKYSKQIFNYMLSKSEI